MPPAVPSPPAVVVVDVKGDTIKNALPRLAESRETAFSSKKGVDAADRRKKSGYSPNTGNAFLSLGDLIVATWLLFGSKTFW